MKKHLTLFWLLLLSTAALAQTPTDLQPLAARTFTRSFNGSNVSLEYTLRAGPQMEPGKRRFIEIDIDTLMHEHAQVRGEHAVPLNGYIAIALPRGIEPDGELRMKFYNGATGRYDFMYSAPYPAAVLDEGLRQGAEDAVSGDAQRILDGLRGLSTGLDGNISFSGPQDDRLLGSDPDYAITGTSWLIPCNSMFQQLVDPFMPERSMDFNPRLKASLPVRISELVTDPRIVVYIGSLSTAVTETTVMSDSIPANVRLLEPAPPVPVAETAEGATQVDSPVSEDPDAMQAAPAPASEGAEAEPEAAAEPVSLRALQYSYGWAAWETVIDLSPVIIASAISPDYSPEAVEEISSPINLDPPASVDSGPIVISAADQTERRSLDDPPLTESVTDPPLDDSSEAISLDDAADAASQAQQDISSDDTEQEVLSPETEVEIPSEPGSDDVTEDTSNDAADLTDSAEAAVPGSLAELKQAVEERRDVESGNSINIELPASARETTPAQTETEDPPVEVDNPQDAQESGETDNEVIETMPEAPVADESAAEAPRTRSDIPAFAFPDELEAIAAAAALEEEDEDEDADPVNADAQTASTEAEVREIEPGSLPGEEDLYSVPLKLITGRDGRLNSQGSSAPDYTQLYIGGGPAQGTGNSTSGPSDLGEMIFVPAGKFMMGTDDKASAGDEDERPLHEVDLADFYIDKYPVTNRQYYQFVLSDGYKPQGNWQKYFEPGTADMPVRGVSWEDANAYARWAGKRLPTEAEWEKAARGTEAFLYPWGNDWSSDILPRGALNYRLVLNQKAASPYGALAMVGVLWQWTASAWAPYPFDPNATGSVKVLRGGAYSNGRNIIRCANRYPEESSVGFNTFTFRCARDK
jgi:formylglycine-generating enzyme required for sulfatase activity